MIEDKLTHEERLRLECIGQAVSLHNLGLQEKKTSLNITNTAGDFYHFITGEYA